MGKKRTSNACNAEEVVLPAEAVAAEALAQISTNEEPAEANLPAAVSPAVEQPAAAETAPAQTDSASASTTYVETAVHIAKDVAQRTVEQIKHQIGEEKTQMAIDYANKAKTEVVEVVDYAKEAVEEATAKVRAKAQTHVNEAKERVNDVKEKATETVETYKAAAVEKVTEVKEKATEKVETYKAAAVEKVTEVKEKATVAAEHYKTIAVSKTEKPRQKATEVVAWLKGDVEETPLEHTAVDLASFVVSTSLTIGASALGLVGLDKKAANVVTVARARATELVGKAPIIGRVHGYASEFWPYRLVTRMASHVDAKVTGRLATTPRATEPQASAETQTAPSASVTEAQ